jgi:hypothetical protein
MRSVVLIYVGQVRSNGQPVMNMIWGGNLFTSSVIVTFTRMALLRTAGKLFPNSVTFLKVR